MEKRNKGKNRNSLQRSYEGYLFIAPWLIGFLAFSLWPMINSAILAFADYNIFSGMTFIGLDNFRVMFTEDKMFGHSLLTTTIYVVVSVPVRLAAALLVALLLNQKIKGMSLYRTIYYLPSVLATSVAMLVTWKMVLSREGIVNKVLELIGLGPYDFLSNPDIALWTISFLAIWQLGSAMVIFLAGLKSIPTELYEAAVVDGSSSWQRFFRITIPLLTPTIFFNLVMGIIGVFQVFSVGFVMTRGGPANATYFYVLHLYRTAFESFRMGYASALAWVLAIIVMALTMLVFKSSDKWVHYEN